MDGIASPVLSIIIPTLNSEKTLQMALDSLLQQRFTDFEICIIDSVSRDRTLSIIKENVERDARVRLVSEKDKGIYDAMNKGIRMAKGEWVFFLGSDDRLYDKDVLASVFAMPAGMGDAGIWPGLQNAVPLPEDTPYGNRATPDFIYGNVISTSYKGPYDGEFTFEKLLSRNISHQAIFYKKSLFDRIGNYNLRYRAHADWDLNIRCFADRSIRVKYMNIVVAEFGADGISSQHDVPFLREVLIPGKLRMLATEGIGRLRDVQAYDEWWRMIRNAGVRNAAQLEEYTGAIKIPRCLTRMVRWQQPVPQKMLRAGAFSKSLMFASYLINRLTGAI